MPLLLLHRPTRYTLGLPAIAAAQLLNWQLMELDGWWLLLAGGWLAWAPPELPAAAVQALQAGAARAFRACAREGQQQGLEQQQRQAAAAGEEERQPLWPPPQRQQQARIAVDGDGSAALQGRAWASWFWEGSSGRQRRPMSGHHQQQQQQQSPAPSFEQALPLGGSRGQGRSGRGSGGGLSPLAAARAALLCVLCLYHVASPLRFLTYPSRWVGLGAASSLARLTELLCSTSACDLCCQRGITPSR